jgi:hypothetical protein
MFVLSDVFIELSNCQADCCAYARLQHCRLATNVDRRHRCCPQELKTAQLRPHLAGLNALLLTEPCDHQVAECWVQLEIGQCTLCSLSRLSADDTAHEAHQNSSAQAPAVRSMSCLQGLTCLTSLTRLVIKTYRPWGGRRLLITVSKLKNLQSLHLPALEHWPAPSPLSALG